jgi:hypothetical protein
VNQPSACAAPQPNFPALSGSSLDVADDENAHVDDEEAGMIEARSLSLSLSLYIYICATELLHVVLAVKTFKQLVRRMEKSLLYSPPCWPTPQPRDGPSNHEGVLYVHLSLSLRARAVASAASNQRDVGYV